MKYYTVKNPKLGSQQNQRDVKIYQPFLEGGEINSAISNAEKKRVPGSSSVEKSMLSQPGLYHSSLLNHLLSFHFFC